ncbi:RDD family protein [Salibacterium sp. K-3]
MPVSNPGGVLHRLGAALIDSAVIMLLNLSLAFVLYGDILVSNTIFLQVFTLLYWVMIPSIWRGRTIGKWMFGLTIASVYREGAGFGTMLLRYLAVGLIYLLTFGIGLIVSIVMMIRRDDRRTLHDLCVGTYVTCDAPEPLDAHTIFNNRKALTAATIVLIAGLFAFDRWEHTTYEDASAAMLEDVDEPVEDFTMERGSYTPQGRASYSPQSEEGIVQTLTHAPEETVLLRRTDDTIYDQYRMDVDGHSLILGERRISFDGQAYEVIGENPAEEVVNRFDPEWEEH